MSKKGVCKYWQLGDKKWLIQKYWNEKMGSPEISNIVGCTCNAVAKALKRLSIPRRSPSEAQKGRHGLGETGFPELEDKQWLIDRYWEEDKNLEEIAQIIGCTASWVGRAMRELGIPRMTNSEVHRSKTASDETKKKMSEDRKGRKGHFFGMWPSEEIKKKEQKAQKGRPRNKGEFAPRFGAHNTKEQNRKISESQKGENNSFYGKKHTEGAREKMQEKRKHQKYPRHHTKPELIYEGFCKKNDLPFKYTGDATFWIGNKPSLNPDFIHLTKKIVVEIFSYHHNSLRRYCKVPYSQTYHGRKEILKRYGWKMIVFWQDDLERPDAEEFVLATLKKEKVI